MAEIWLIGRQVTLPNGHKYIAEPFIAFDSNAAAQGACDMIEKVTGERLMLASAPLFKKGEYREPPAPPEPAKSKRDDWHYDSQGYCDNPGRGY